MIKFEYHYQDQTLYLQEEGKPRSLESTFTTNWGGAGFVLEPINHWITFTEWSDRIKVFYKEVKPHPQGLWAPEIITYYSKELLKPQEPHSLTFTFAPQDEVHKVNNQWVKKSHD